MKPIPVLMMLASFWVLAMARSFAAPMPDTRFLPLKSAGVWAGMPATEVRRLMGEPLRAKDFPNMDIKLQTLHYLDQGLETLVSLAEGKVYAVTVRPKALLREDLPPFARAIEQGMTREALVSKLGEPVFQHRFGLPNEKAEKLVFRKDGRSVNVYLVGERVQSVRGNTEAAPTVLGMVLPARTDTPGLGMPAERIRIGISQEQATAIYGQPDAVFTSTYGEQKKTDYTYSKLDSNASATFTFIDGVLVRFSFIPQSQPYRR